MSDTLLQVDGRVSTHGQTEAVAQACVALLYKRDRQNRPEIVLESAGAGRAEVALTVADHMVNGHNTCHGGVIFTLADTAFAYACNTYDRVTVAAGASIDFLAPANVGDRLLATALERHRSGRRGVYDVTVNTVDPAGGDRVVAIFQGRSQEVGGAILDAPCEPSESG